MRCLILGISHDGQGVGRIDGKVVFVPEALPGEDVELTIREEKKNYLRGRLSSIIEPAPERVNPPCPYFGQCGGCQYQHASYELQVDLKTRVVEQTLRRVGGIDIEVLPCIPAVKPWHYRNKVVWHGAFLNGKWSFGYYRGETNHVINIERCLLISEAMQKASLGLSKALKDLKPRMPLDATVRQSNSNGRIMAVIRGVDRKAALEVLARIDDLLDSLYLVDEKKVEVLKEGRGFEEILENMRFKLSPLSFFQVNSEQAGTLIDIVKNFLKLQGGEILLDAYCGVGTLALSMADRAKHVVGVESFPSAVQDAAKNARLNGLKNCRFLPGTTEQILPTLSQRFDAAILDPPRSGCQTLVIKAIERLKIPKLVYVSCEPSTLARDLSRFKQAGYRIEEVQPLDMFPQTYHVETVVLMSRTKN